MITFVEFHTQLWDRLNNQFQNIEYWTKMRPSSVGKVSERDPPADWFCKCAVLLVKYTTLHNLNIVVFLSVCLSENLIFITRIEKVKYTEILQFVEVIIFGLKSCTDLGDVIFRQFIYELQERITYPFWQHSSMTDSKFPRFLEFGILSWIFVGSKNSRISSKYLNQAGNFFSFIAADTNAFHCESFDRRSRACEDIMFSIVVNKIWTHFVIMGYF